MALSDLHIDRNRLAALCRRYGIERLEIIGSFAKGDAGPGSDVDILVTFGPETRIGLEFVRLKEELEALFGRKVDLLTRASVENSPNKYFRRFALRRTEAIYESASSIESSVLIADNINNDGKRFVQNKTGGKTMTGENKPNGEGKDSIPRKFEELIKAAQEQPGVQDFMEVYNTWKTFDAIHQIHQGVLAVKRVVALSDTSSSDLT